MYSDGSWEMYTDFVGGVQFWGYALASGSGDGAVRMWDSESFPPSLASFWESKADNSISENWPSSPDASWSYCPGHLSPI